MTLSIPDELIRTLHLSEGEILVELAVALYAANKISFSMARRLAGLDWYRFRVVLAQRNIPMHYSIEAFEEDLANLTRLETQK